MPRRYNTVIVPVDFSERSALALGAAKELIEDGGEIHVVHALPPLATVEPGVLWGTIDDDTRRQRTREAMRELCEGADIASARREVLSGSGGNPAADVVGYADDVDADVIVISSHGRTGLARFALGSVAERVVRHATCDVLVVRARPESD